MGAVKGWGLPAFAKPASSLDRVQTTVPWDLRASGRTGLAPTARGIAQLNKPARVLALAAVAVLLVAIAALLSRGGSGITGRPSTETEPSSWYIDVVRYNQ